jgi:HK97 gp10 family phage protein
VVNIAKLTVALPTNFEERLSQLGDRTDEIAERVLKTGGEVVLNQVKSNLNSVLSGKSTGELAGSLGMSPVKVNRKGDYDLKIGFAEPRKGTGKSNAKIANILEYGSSRQKPRPFMKPAKSQSKNAAISAMERKFNDEVNKL